MSRAAHAANLTFGAHPIDDRQRPPHRRRVPRPPGSRLEPTMRFTIGIKIFGIAVGLLILMAVVALLSMRMTRTVDDQLVIIDQNYFPAYVALAQANIRSIEESAYT